LQKFLMPDLNTKIFFSRFFRNIACCFKGRNLIWQIIFIIFTYLSVNSGFDWFYYVNTQGHLVQNILFPAVIIGGIVPILLPLFLLALGLVWKDFKMRATAFALAQAGILALLLSWFYKAFTGRIQPPYFSSTVLDISHSFKFGFLEHGVFWGWPSSHATVAFAMALTLFMIYRSSRAVRWSALIVAIYIAIGVSTNIHWFSDAVSGAILGSIIGVVVGRSFGPASSVGQSSP